MMSNLVSELYQENRVLSDYLMSQQEVSFRSQLDDTFKKVLLLAAASNLELQLVTLLKGFVASASRSCEPLVSFVDRMAIRRKYHTYFDWDRLSPNPFFSLFGDELGREMKRDRQNDPDLDDGVKAFLELGSLRNNMVHNDYVSFTLEKTVDEVFELYKSSLAFIDYLSTKLSGVVSQ